MGILSEQEYAPLLKAWVSDVSAPPTLIQAITGTPAMGLTSVTRDTFNAVQGIKTITVDGVVFEYNPLSDKIRKVSAVKNIFSEDYGWVSVGRVTGARIAGHRQFKLNINGGWFLTSTKHYGTGTIEINFPWIINRKGNITPDKDGLFIKAITIARKSNG